MGKVLPSQRLLKRRKLVFGDMNLSIVRSAAQMMLQYALEREVTEALGRATTRTLRRRRRRKAVVTGMNRIEFHPSVGPSASQIREHRQVFVRSSVAYVSRTEKLDELIARMYVPGTTRDIEATFFGRSEPRACHESDAVSVGDFEVFRKRDLSSEDCCISSSTVLALPPGSREERAHPR